MGNFQDSCLYYILHLKLIFNFALQASRPGELTVDDVRAWPYALFVGLGLLWLGIVVGRGNLYGFEYGLLLLYTSLEYKNLIFVLDDRVKPAEVSPKAH